MHCRVLNIEKTLFAGAARRITLQTPSGETTVLGCHLPIVSIVNAGPVVIEDAEGALHRYDFGSGFLEVLPENKGVVLLEAGAGIRKEKGRVYAAT